MAHSVAAHHQINMKALAVLFIAAIVSAAVEESQREDNIQAFRDTSNKPKRGLFELDQGYGHGYSYAGYGLPEEPVHSPHPGIFDLALHHHHPPLRTISIPKKVSFSDPYTVEVVKKVPVPVKVPIAIPVAKPYPVQYLVEKKVPVPYPIQVEVPQMYSTKAVLPIFLHQHYHHHHGEAGLQY